ncbi:hypothetical protein HJFPF1_09966 [Paramyrothecium foliicola]|nr:hypothetical protein HJFPF1_09966 [Paramyrothecium foliicola]
MAKLVWSLGRPTQLTPTGNIYTSMIRHGTLRQNGVALCTGVHLPAAEVDEGDGCDSFASRIHEVVPCAQASKEHPGG